MKILLSKFLIYILFPLTLTVSAHSISLPKIGGDKSSAGGNLEDTKLKFTKVFFESSFDELHAARPISVKERITVLNIVDFIV